MTNGSLMKVESIAECSLGAFCNTFDLHQAIIGLENQFVVFLRVALVHRFYCNNEMGNGHMSKINMRFWYFSHIQATKALTSLHICEVSLEPLLLAHTKYGHR